MNSLKAAHRAHFGGGAKLANGKGLRYFKLAERAEPVLDYCPVRSSDRDCSLSMLRIRAKAAAPITLCFTRSAFTMAEVLITLAIIGVVAAMTIPTLTLNYKKRALSTRIAKFASVMQQVNTTAYAYNYNGFDNSMLLAANNPDYAEEFIRVNYKPYLKLTNIDKRQYGAIAALADGSGMYVRKTGCELKSTACTYVTFCIDYNTCKTADESILVDGDGKNSFRFYTDGSPEAVEYLTSHEYWDGSREGIIDICRRIPYFCTTLIMLDGWEIKDDYPFWSVPGFTPAHLIFFRL